MFLPTHLAPSACLAGLVLLGAASAAAAPIVTPHRAVYDLSLAKATTGGTIAQAHGKLEFEWGDACTNWTISQRTRVRLVGHEGSEIEFAWSLSALEAKDGSSYRFFIRRLNTGEPPEELRGEARPGLATYAEPEGRELELPKGTLFPSAHSLLLISNAEGGGAPFGRVVFDGSGEDGIFFVSAAASQALPADAKPSFESALLRGQKSWRVTLAYFSLDESVVEPEHEQELRLYANGVVDELILDYNDFALRATLESLVELPGAGC